MDEADKRAFAARLTGCCEYYGIQPMGKSVMALWWEQFKGYSIDQFGSALNAHIRNADRGRFMPRVADILAVIEGDPEEHAARAWLTARRAVREIGNYNSVAFDDPLIAQTIQDMGGWQRLCDMDHDAMVWAEKDFVAKYSMTKKRGDCEHTGVLPGLIASHNAQANQLAHIPKPIPIGYDMARAKANAERADAQPAFSNRIGDLVRIIAQRKGDD